MSARSVLLAALVATAMSACALLPARVIDGWRIGAAVDCTQHDCPAIVREATRGLDVIAPGHPAIAATSVVEWAFEVMPTVSSGLPFVVVLGLADGSVRAVGVMESIGVVYEPTALEFVGSSAPDASGSYSWRTIPR
jgi:hypothetical protein